MYGSSKREHHQHWIGTEQIAAPTTGKNCTCTHHQECPSPEERLSRTTSNVQHFEWCIHHRPAQVWEVRSSSQIRPYARALRNISQQPLTTDEGRTRSRQPQNSRLLPVPFTERLKHPKRSPLNESAPHCITTALGRNVSMILEITFRERQRELTTLHAAAREGRGSAMREPKCYKTDRTRTGVKQSS